MVKFTTTGMYAGLPLLSAVICGNAVSVICQSWILWIAPLFIVITSNLLTADFDPLTLLAALVCVTSLIFATNDMYGFISWRRREILMDL
jgi:hypothetical protein